MSAPYTPVAQLPSAPGQLSNKLGSNFTTDALPYTFRYQHPRGSADKAGQVRFQAVRLQSAAAGSVQAPLPIWDTGYAGQPTVTALPVALHDFGCAAINGRVYITGGQDAGGNIRSEVWSAPFRGGSVGTWRAERALTLYQTTSPRYSGVGRYAHACCTATFGATGGQGSPGVGVGGTSWLMVYGGFTQDSGTAATGHHLAARILPDGTLAPWITMSINTAARAWGQLTPVPNEYLTSGLVLSGGVSSTTGVASNNAWTTAVRNAGPSAQWPGDFDTPEGWWTPLPNMTAGVAGHSMIFDWDRQVLIAFKGSDNSASNQSGFYYLPYSIDLNAWHQAWGAWGAATVSGAVVQNKAQLLYLMATGGISFFFLFGGSSATSITDRASALATIQYGRIVWSGTAPSGTVTFLNSATPLPSAACGGGFSAHDYGHNERGPATNFPLPILDRPKGFFTYFGGQNSLNAALSSVQSASIPVSTSNPYQPFGSVAFDITSPWRSGQGAGLSGADVGTSGSLVTNADGSQDVTINQGGVDPSAVAPANGDLIQVNAWSQDVVGGDPSPIGSTLVRIGQPPSITNISLNSTATGQPTISWAYNAGSGGGPQATWRVVVTRNSNSHVMFDSGTRVGIANSCQIQCAPMLLSATAYTATVTVTSTDSPVSASSASQTGTLAISQTLGTIPGVPTGLSVSGDATNKWALLSATTLVNTTGVRIYYRDPLVSAAWRLLVDNYASGVGAFSVKLMDKITLGRALDYSISALGGGGESAQSSAVSATVPVDADSPSGFLHLAGQPLTGALGLAVKAQAQWKLSALHDSKTLTRYNASRALVRQGTLDMRRLELTVFSAYGATTANLENVRDQLLAGGVVWWRDKLGTTLPMALESPEDVETFHPSHRNFTLRLVQVDDLYSPYLTQGSADGIPTLANGSIPPLNEPVEQVA